MARGEVLDVAAERDEGLHLGGRVQVPVLIATGVEGHDAHGISSDQEVVGALVVEHKRENATQLVEKVPLIALVERDDDFTIGVRLEGELRELLTQLLVVVNLTVDSQYHVLGLVGERLGTVLHVHDGETLVGQDGVVVRVKPAPVWSAVSQQSGHGHRTFAECLWIAFDIENACNAAHVRATPSLASGWDFGSTPRTMPQ